MRKAVLQQKVYHVILFDRLSSRQYNRFFVLPFQEKVHETPLSRYSLFCFHQPSG